MKNYASWILRFVRSRMRKQQFCICNNNKNKTFCGNIRRKFREQREWKRCCCFLVVLFLLVLVITVTCFVYLMVEYFTFVNTDDDGPGGYTKGNSIIKSIKPPSQSLFKKLHQQLLLLFNKISNSMFTSELQLQQKITFNRNRNVVSYSVFGKDALKKYTSNIISVAEETFTSSLYNTWHVRIYTDLNIPVFFVERVQAINPLVTFIDVSQLNISQIFKTVHRRLHGKSAGKDTYKKDPVYTDLRLINGMVWRFHAMADTTVDIMCSRDLDSPLYTREEAAVREFLVSPPQYLFHVMRDSRSHNSRVMGGMFCYRNARDRLLGQILFTAVVKNSARRGPFYGESPKGHDQYTLNKHVWPVLRHRAMVHDSYYCHWAPGGRAFPTRRNFSTEPFVGCASRPCDYVKDVEVFRCPVQCRPRLHKDWEYC